MTKIRADGMEIQVEMVSPIRQPRGLHIVMEDSRPFDQIAQDFSGHQQLEVVSDQNDGVTTYTGYTEITSMYRRGDEVTVVLEKGD